MRDFLFVLHVDYLKLPETDKPAPEELRYFLEFQVPLQWAPAYNELPLGLSPQFRKASTPSVRFSFMGPQLHINTTEVIILRHSFFLNHILALFHVNNWFTTVSVIVGAP